MSRLLFWNFEQGNAFSLAATAGTFTFTGPSVGLVATRVLSASPGTFTFTGQAVTLTYLTGGSFLLTAEPGVFTFTAQADLKAARKLAAQNGTFTFTGQSADLRTNITTVSTGSGRTRGFNRPFLEADPFTRSLQVTRNWPKELNSQPVVSMGSFVNDSPVAGSVSWSNVVVEYGREQYRIDDSNTANKWVYWAKSNPTTLLKSASCPTITEDLFIVGVNTSGKWRSQWKSGQGLEVDMIFGDIVANTVQAGAIDGQTMTGVTITGSTVTGTTVEASQFTDLDGNVVIDTNNRGATVMYPDAIVAGNPNFGPSSGILTENNGHTVHMIGTATNGVIRIDNTQVVRNRITGWSAATGTGSSSTFDTSTVTTEELAKRVKTLIDNLMTHGLIG